MTMIKAGLVGCGNISSIYLENCHKLDHLTIVACADLNHKKAQAQAANYHIPNVCKTDELLQNHDIELIINLTTPDAHGPVCIRALEAGKHVYTEKPLAVTLEEGQHMLKLAKEKGLLVGCAPDTFLGAGIQTALQAIEQGEIGKPVGASAFMIGRGHEHWHPDPAFYYDVGGGPMFDMGPYYLTALTALLGPMTRLSGSARVSYPERTILSEPKYGEKIQVSTPTHIAGIIDFDNGAVASITTSFDAFGGSSLPHIEIYGDEGTLLVPDPNTFGGPVKLRKRDKKEFVSLPLSEHNAENSRGIGIADMVHSILNDTPHRANGELGYHVLEAMHGFHTASSSETYYKMQSTCQRPEPLPAGFHILQN
ncbi:Gfo/Idh/MocA family oxidoreductase [Bacillus sp. A301a_S52]|nr:Gfo/Idh/MocA family oxidoreductase [Bacillus sp. A301a_S52]